MAWLASLEANWIEFHQNFNSWQLRAFSGVIKAHVLFSFCLQSRRATWTKETKDRPVEQQEFSVLFLLWLQVVFSPLQLCHLCLVVGSRFVYSTAHDKPSAPKCSPSYLRPSSLVGIDHCTVFSQHAHLLRISVSTHSPTWLYLYHFVCVCSQYTK